MGDIVLDFETASSVDLKEVGASVYAQHPTTEILCLVYGSQSWDDLRVWLPGEDDAFLRHLVEDISFRFVSHGSFEQDIWRYMMVPLYGVPPLPLARWHDIMASAAWHSLPLRHEQLSKVLKNPFPKDMIGSRLTTSLSKAKKNGSYDRSARTLASVIEYCKQDVRGEMWNHTFLGNLSAYERRVWELDQKINQRGIKIDVPFVHAALDIVGQREQPLLKEFQDLTGGLRPAQTAKVSGPSTQPVR